MNPLRKQLHLLQHIVLGVVLAQSASTIALAQPANTTEPGSASISITPHIVGTTERMIAPSASDASPDASRPADHVDQAEVALNPWSYGMSSSVGILNPTGLKVSAGDAAGISDDSVLKGNFFERLRQYYSQDWAGINQSVSAPAKRGLAAPLDSAPFPSSDWGYGGAPDIGAPDGNSYPLMSALKLNARRTKIYGWIAPSINFSTSGHNNFPVSYDIFPNKIELNQAVVYVERLPDTVQKTHFDWGYHLTAFYGIDYRFTTAKDYLSQQLLKSNRQYGFDPVLEYADFYFPVKDGLNIRAGRFLSVPGIEAQLAPNNYNMTHSLLYTIDPFTESGAIGTLKLNKQWMVQLGISAGHDVAIWSDDHKPSGIACLDYSTESNNDNFYACANGINSGKYAYNNLQDYDFTWYHKFNSKWHSATETWYMYERDVPNVAGNVVNPVPTETGANGAYCKAGEQRCTAPEYSIVNYLNREVNSKLMVGFRSDFLDDKKGQRTGLASKYTENTLFATKYVGSSVLFRPELRFDHSWDLRGYNAGTSRNQLFFGMDVIYKF